eukprot:IDg4310t1
MQNGHFSTTTRLPPRSANHNYGLGRSGRISIRKGESTCLSANHGYNVDTLGAHHHCVLVPVVQADAYLHRSRALTDFLQGRLNDTGTVNSTAPLGGRRIVYIDGHATLLPTRSSEFIYSTASSLGKYSSELRLARRDPAVDFRNFRQ